MIHRQIITFNKRMVKITHALFFVLCLMTSSIGHMVDGRHSSLNEDFERQLNLINRSHVKSIQTKSGYIVDCVDIHKQPAFDHLLLKNHKLQRKPTFERKINETSAATSPTKHAYGFEKVRCPKGTVPIRRIIKDDLIRGKSLFNEHSLNENDGAISHYANVFLNSKGGPYYGVGGTTSVYNPEVVKGQSSAGHVFVQNGEGDGTNKIVVGWHVSPLLYNDGGTYIYSVWTPDNFKTGCYNMLCPGFIQTDQSYYPGMDVGETSTYGGVMIELPISLHQDEKGNWWLHVVDKDIGYFPAALFSKVGWGGFTVTPTNALSPPMGSGHFPN
ncbi:uncharacterized protein [Medicago truncatula]|uniref:uncharacterized protein n=1 Tax=Medicago truncatula TaxID=3880 RepID=UPI000D2F32F1|nr:uncharacterized protein LOC11431549 [Medicago truncatula]